MSTIINILFWVIAGYVLGYVLTICTKIEKSSGEIVMMDDSIYLNINKKDIEKYQDGEFVTLRIKRRNFSGFNEE